MLRVDCEKYYDVFSALAECAFTKLGLKGDAVAEADFVTAEEIRDLNRETRGVDRETDVLSFPALNEIKPFTKENYPFDYDAEKAKSTWATSSSAAKLPPVRRKNTATANCAKTVTFSCTACCIFWGTTISRKRTARSCAKRKSLF